MLADLTLAALKKFGSSIWSGTRPGLESQECSVARIGCSRCGVLKEWSWITIRKEEVHGTVVRNYVSNWMIHCKHFVMGIQVAILGLNVFFLRRKCEALRSLCIWFRAAIVSASLAQLVELAANTSRVNSPAIGKIFTNRQLPNSSNWNSMVQLSFGRLLETTDLWTVFSLRDLDL